MSQEETNEPEENDGRNYIYRVLFEGSGKMERFVIHERPDGNIVLPDEPDALLNVAKYPLIRMVNADTLDIRVDEPGICGYATCPIDVLDQRAREFWSRSRGAAKIAINAYRIGRDIGSEDTKKQAIQKLETLLALASGPPVRDEDE